MGKIASTESTYFFTKNLQRTEWICSYNSWRGPINLCSSKPWWSRWRPQWLGRFFSSDHFQPRHVDVRWIEDVCMSIKYYIFIRICLDELWLAGYLEIATVIKNTKKLWDSFNFCHCFSPLRGKSASTVVCCGPNHQICSLPTERQRC